LIQTLRKKVDKKFHRQTLTLLAFHFMLQRHYILLIHENVAYSWFSKYTHSNLC